MEKFCKNNSIGQLNSTNKKRVPIKLIDKKTGSEHLFNSRFKAAEWLIANNKTTTKNPNGLSRRIALQKYVCGYKIYNINAERLGDMP